MASVGLTEAEARARLAAGQQNTTRVKPTRPRDLVRRESVLTIFHLNIIGLALIQLLMREWVGALLTLLVSLATTGIRAGQEAIARRRIDAVEQTLRPRATVVRDGRTKSIDADQVVRGDLLVISPGDQFQVDGHIVGDGSLIVNTSMVTGERGLRRVQAGEEVLAGSYCVSGRARFLADRVGADRFIHARIAGRRTLAERPTPLERLITRILYALLMVVVVYAAILVAKYFRLDIGAPGDAFIDAAPVIFSLLPTGLYLMIVSTYSTGTADLAKMGALVHSARSVEALSESNVVCFTDVGLLSGAAMDLTPAPRPPDDEDWPSPSQLRQLIGDFARSTSTPTPISEALARAFEGEQSIITTEAAHFATLGWTALAFDDDPDLFVLAEPRLLDGVAGSADAEGPRPDSEPEDGQLDGLVLAFRPNDVPLVDDVGRPRLPDGLIPLCTIKYGRRIRPESLQLVRDFVASGVRIKVFSAEPPERVIAALRATGLSAEDERQWLAQGGLSSIDLSQLPQDQWVNAVSEHRLFGGLTPDQVGEVVRLLRASGNQVTVVGDGLTDLDALQEANLAVAQAASAQAALGSADIVLLSNSPAALLKVLHKGQSMVRGLLDVIKLNLVLVVCSALLIVAVRSTGAGFPYLSGQGTLISILAVTVPSLVLPFWAAHGTVSSASYRLILVRFVLPPAVLLCASAFLVYLLVLNRTGVVATAQLAVTYTLLYSGVLLTVLLKPPLRNRPPRLPGGPAGRDWRGVVLAAILATVGTLVPVVPLGRHLFRLDVLPHLGYYVAVALAVLGWLVAVQMVWRFFPRVDIPREEPPVTDDAVSRG